MSEGNLIKVAGIVIMIISILLGIAIGSSGVGLAGILIGIFLICLGLIICDTSNLNLQISELSTRLIISDKKNKEEIKRITARGEALLTLLATIEQKSKYLPLLLLNLIIRQVIIYLIHVLKEKLMKITRRDLLILINQIVIDNTALV